MTVCLILKLETSSKAAAYCNLLYRHKTPMSLFELGHFQTWILPEKDESGS